MPIVDLTSKTVGGFVETRELVDLPTANRSFTSYLAVLPGVVGGNIGGQGGTLYSFDGGNLNDATRGGDQVRIPIEAIQEFQLIVSQPDAQFGANGGVINAVSKTGTNEVHGTALSLIRDSALQERSYFQKLRNADRSPTRFATSSRSRWADRSFSTRCTTSAPTSITSPGTRGRRTSSAGPTST